MTDYGRFGDLIISDWIDEIAAMDLYGSICHANPLIGDQAASYAAEVVGTDYHRQEMPTTRDAYNLLSNTEALIWRNLPAGTNITWLAAFDDDTAGRCVAAAPLWQAFSLPTGGTYALEPGDFVFGLDVAVGPP